MTINVETVLYKGWTGPDRTGVSVCLPPITTRGLSHLSINLIIPITPWLIILTGDGDQLGYLSWSLPHLRAKSCSAQLTFPIVILFDYLLPTWSVYPPWLPPASSPFTILSIYDVSDAVTWTVPVRHVVPLIKLHMDPNATDFVLHGVTGLL